MSSWLSEPANTMRGPVRPQPLCEGVSVLFTDRAGGVSSGPFRTLNLSDAVGDDPAAVASNRASALRAIGPGPKRLAWMRQVHGAGVVYVSGLRAPRAGGLRGDADRKSTRLNSVTRSSRMPS